MPRSQIHQRTTFIVTVFQLRSKYAEHLDTPLSLGTKKPRKSGASLFECIMLAAKRR